MTQWYRKEKVYLPKKRTLNMDQEI
jgi:hypothetical protein